MTGSSARRAVLLVDHGSRLDAANEQLEEIARRVRAREPSWIVHVAHLEIAQPDIPAGIARCADDGATEIVVHPYFLGPGRHTTRDIPRIVEQARTAHPDVEVRVSEPLGVHDKIIDVVLERISKSR